MIPVRNLNRERRASSPLLTLYNHILETFQNSRREKESYDQIITRCKFHVQNFFDLLFFNQKYRFISSNESYLLKMLDKICSIVMNKYSLIVPNSQIKMYSKAFVEYTKNANDALMSNRFVRWSKSATHVITASPVRSSKMHRSTSTSRWMTS